MKKATHRGHCQVCSRIQKLVPPSTANVITPDTMKYGVMAKHGYQVLGGYFQGTCFGSGHLPIEKDKTLVKESIAWAVQRWLEANGMAKIWAQPATEPKKWHHVYVPAKWIRGGAYYQWQRCEMKLAGEGQVQVCMNGAWERGSRYSLFARTEEDLLNIATESHETYLKNYLQPFMREMNRYCKDQQWKIDTWHEQPLLPLED